MYLYDSCTPIPIPIPIHVQVRQLLEIEFSIGDRSQSSPPPLSLPPTSRSACARRCTSVILSHPDTTQIPPRLCKLTRVHLDCSKSVSYLRMDDILESRGLQPLSENWVLFHSRVRPSCHTHRIWDLMAVSSHELSIIETIWLRKRLTLLAIF